MRLTNEEILTKFPSWSNRLSVRRYSPIRKHSVSTLWRHTRLPIYTRILQSLSARNRSPPIKHPNAYIYSQHGAYDIYKAIAGDIYIHTETQQVLYGSLNIPYRNKSITIHLNLMYGLKALSLLSLRGTGKVKGWCNKDGQGSPANHLNTEELDIIKSVLNNPMEDYGYAVQKFMQTARELYAEDPYNNIMNKTFEL